MKKCGERSSRTTVAASVGANRWANLLGRQRVFHSIRSKYNLSAFSTWWDLALPKLSKRVTTSAGKLQLILAVSLACCRPRAVYERGSSWTSWRSIHAAPICSSLVIEPPHRFAFLHTPIQDICQAGILNEAKIQHERLTPA